MIKSMTAFASAEKTKNDIVVAVEIRSYNSKYLDIALRLSRKYGMLEEKIKSVISEKISRGRVEINLKITDTSDEAYAFEVNELQAEAYHTVLVQLKEKFNMRDEISLDILLKANGIIQPIEVEKDLADSWPIIQECINEAMDGLNEMRKNEGSFMAKDLAERLAYIEKRIELIEKESKDILPIYQERLSARISSLTKDLLEIDPGRIAQEAAFLADKSDISEEVVRARSHIKQFRSIMDSKQPAGRKLNFLLQEFNREFNTMGSKVGNADVSHVVVDLKSELEKIREQVQNVE